MREVLTARMHRIVKCMNFCAFAKVVDRHASGASNREIYFDHHRFESVMGSWSQEGQDETPL